MSSEEMSTTRNKIKKEMLTTDDVKFIFNELRKSSIIWKGRRETLQKARVKTFVRRAKNGNPVYKYQWQCAVCKNWKRSEKEVEVDHISEIGGVSGYSGDWNEVINKMFPRPVELHLQILCVACHARKTNLYNSARTKWARK